MTSDEFGNVVVKMCRSNMILIQNMVKWCECFEYCDHFMSYCYHIFFTGKSSRYCIVLFIFTYLIVCHLVVVQIGAGGKALPADAAFVRLLAAVDAPVRVERR